MDAKSWIFSLFTGLVLTAAALVNAFLLMWGMMHYKTSVKPYAYALFGVSSLIIIFIATAFAGPVSGWAAKKLFPKAEWAGVLAGITASVLAIVIGGAALFVASATVLSVFRDPLPRLGSAMHVQFPKKTSVVFERQGKLGESSWTDELIVKLDADGWEEFRRSPLFQTQELRIARADDKRNLDDWQTFKNAENQAQSYRWTNHTEPTILKVLARRADEQIYVYLYLIRNAKEN